MPPEIQNAVNLLTLESVNVTLDRLLFKQMPSLILLHTFTPHLILTYLSAILIPFALMPFLFFVEFYFVGWILFTRNSNKYFYLRMPLSSHILNYQFLLYFHLLIYYVWPWVFLFHLTVCPSFLFEWLFSSVWLRCHLSWLWLLTDVSILQKRAVVSPPFYFSFIMYHHTTSHLLIISYDIQFYWYQFIITIWPVIWSSISSIFPYKCLR